MLDHVRSVPGLWAVMTGGSINWLPDDAELDPHSDIDLWHLVEGDPDPSLRQRKFHHDGVILEPFYARKDVLADPAAALGDWIMAVHLMKPGVIHDPTGELGRVQQVVARRYAEPGWVRRRCGVIESELRAYWLPCLRGEVEGDPLFAFGLTVNNLGQLPAVAAVRPPTIRKGGAVFTEMMRARGRDDLAEELLELLGSSSMSRAEIEHLVAAVTPLYDRAVEVHRTPFEIDFDLDPGARDIMVGGARDLVARGWHREAAWWIYFVDYVSRSALVLDAPAEFAERWEPVSRGLHRALGIDTAEGRRLKAAMAEGLLAKVMAVTEEIIRSTRAVEAP